MPLSKLTDSELANLLESIIATDGAEDLRKLVQDCHEHESFALTSPLTPHEVFFRKRLAYRDFDIHIPNCVIDGNDVITADIQFKRPSQFPQPYLNRNRGLVRELRGLLSQHYEGEEIRVIKYNSVHEIHFKAYLAHRQLDNVPEWRGECSLFDEPYSSGQANPNYTKVRKDFVILRFNRAGVP